MVFNVISRLADFLFVLLILIVAALFFWLGRRTANVRPKKWWRKKKAALLTKWLRFRYRNQDGDECICGSNIDQMVAGITCKGTCKSVKEWVIEEEVRRRMS